MTRLSTLATLTSIAAMLAAGTELLAAPDGASLKDGVVEVPAALNADRLSTFRVVSAKGAQVYTCSTTPMGGPGWVLKGPDAQLFDSQNMPAGKHYDGPTWEGLDGGKVVGQVRTSMRAPVEKAVPWLLLDIKSREGSGAFTQAQAVVRMDTAGGAAPADGCDAARAGQVLRVPYSAVYVFLK